MLAFVGRQEPRDLLDLAALENRHGLTELCRLAANKDTGFRSAHAVIALDYFEAIAQQLDETNTDTPLKWTSTVKRWRHELAQISISDPRITETQPTDDLDFGIDF